VETAVLCETLRGRTPVYATHAIFSFIFSFGTGIGVCWVWCLENGRDYKLLVQQFSYFIISLEKSNNSGSLLNSFAQKSNTPSREVKNLENTLSVTIGITKFVGL
jgi:hypothetical protein